MWTTPRLVSPTLHNDMFYQHEAGEMKSVVEQAGARNQAIVCRYRIPSRDADQRVIYLTFYVQRDSTMDRQMDIGPKDNIYAYDT